MVKWCSAEMVADPKYRILRAMAEVGMIDQYVGVKQDGHYSHQYTMSLATIDVNNDEEEEYQGKLEPLLVGLTLEELFESIGGENALTDMEKDMLESARDYAAKIYADLEKEYDYLSSEEAFAEACEANDWSFDETGEME